MFNTFDPQGTDSVGFGTTSSGAMAAYEDAIRRTDAHHAPWYVIPTDNKKYARMALTFLIVDVLRHLDLPWPAADCEPETERTRIEVS